MKPLAIFAVVFVATGFNAQAQTTVAAKSASAPTTVAVVQTVSEVPSMRFQVVKPTMPVAPQVQTSKDQASSQSTPLDEINVGLESLHPRAIPSYRG